MSLRDLVRYADAYERRQKRELHRSYMVAAAQTCELVNILGSAYSSKEKPWQLMEPRQFFEAWTGTGSKPVIDQEYVEAVLAAIKEREASVTFMGQE